MLDHKINIIYSIWIGEDLCPGSEEIGLSIPNWQESAQWAEFQSKEMAKYFFPTMDMGVKMAQNWRYSIIQEAFSY